MYSWQYVPLSASFLLFLLYSWSVYKQVSFAVLPSAACHKILLSPRSSSKSLCRCYSGWRTLRWKMVLCVLSWRPLLCSTPQGTGSVMVLALCSLWDLEWTRKGQKQNCPQGRKCSGLPFREICLRIVKGGFVTCCTNSMGMQTSDLALGACSRQLAACHQAQQIFQGKFPIAQAGNSVLAVVLKDEPASGTGSHHDLFYHLPSHGRKSI